MISSVRQFMPGHQTTGISRSALANNRPFNAQAEDNEELTSILGLITEKGELVLKNKKINVIPRTFYRMRFDKILILDM